MRAKTAAKMEPRSPEILRLVVVGGKSDQSKISDGDQMVCHP